MNRIATLLALALPAALLSFASPATAAPVVCAPSTVSPAEWDQLHRGQPLSQVTAIIGGPGTYLASESAGGRFVYRWTFCSSSGTADLKLSFWTFTPSSVGDPIVGTIPQPGH